MFRARLGWLVIRPNVELVGLRSGEAGPCTDPHSAGVAVVREPSSADQVRHGDEAISASAKRLDQHRDQLHGFAAVTAAVVKQDAAALFGVDLHQNAIEHLLRRPVMKRAVDQFKDLPRTRILWASPRETLNVYQADQCGCHIITAPADILKKLPALGTKTGADLSLDAVKAFREDALAAGLQLAVPAPRAAE